MVQYLSISRSFFSFCVQTRIDDFMHLRFQNFKEKPLSCFRIFDYARWPNERDEVITHGDEDLADLLTFFDTIFNEEERDAIRAEFPKLKAYLKGRHPKDMKQVQLHMM